MSRTSLFVSAFVFAGTLTVAGSASAAARDAVASTRGDVTLQSREAVRPVRGDVTAPVGQTEGPCGDCQDDYGDDNGCFLGLIDINLGAVCGVVADVDVALACNPLSVEAACIAELGADCSIDAFVKCTADLVAECEAAVDAGGALFCDGVYLGADVCLGGLLDLDLDLGLDLNLDVDACLDVDLAADVDLDLGVDIGLGLCLDVDLDANVTCEIEAGVEAAVKCDPLAVKAACLANLGADCDKHDFAACQAELIADCKADVELGGAVFCDADIYVGADICLGLDLGIDIGL